MADLKISQLSDGGASQATDEYVVARSGANYRIDGASVAAAATSVGTLTSLTVSGDLTVDTSTLKVDSTNNRVGIGTASPSFALDVSGADGVRARVLATSGGTPGLVLSSAGNTAYTIKAGNTDNSLRIDQDGTDRIILSSGGNLAVDTNTLYVDATNNRVGIGLTNPSETLDVKGTGNFNAVSGTYLQFQTNGSNVGYVATANSVLTGGSSTNFALAATNNLVFGIGSAEKMRLDASGNLGLGVTPSAFGSAFKAFQITSLGAIWANTSGLFISNNVYNDGAGNKYIGSATATRYYQLTGQHVWETAASGTAGNAITFTQAMTLDASGGLQVYNAIGVGNTAPTTSGAGITFPATQSASSNANTLDDYEEGTWTGTLKGLTADPTTPVTATGKYTKIGKQVTVAIYFNSVTTTGASGDVLVSGLPFTEDGTRAVATVATYTFDFNGGTSLYGDFATTSIYLLASRDDADWVAVKHNAGTDRYLRITGTYFV